MRKELFAALAATELAACAAPENRLEGIDGPTCYDQATHGVMDLNIIARPTDRPDYTNPEFDELWQMKGDTANRVEQLVAIASLPQLDGDYTEYTGGDVEVLPELDSVPMGGDDLDYPVGLMTSINYGDEAALDGTWVNIAIVNRQCDTLHGWGEFSFYCEEDNCRPDYNVSRDSFLDFDGEMTY